MMFEALQGRVISTAPLDSLKFGGNGENPYEWLSQIDRFFTLRNLPDEQRLSFVFYHLEGEALAWFQWLEMNCLLTSWSGFLQLFKSRFGSKFDDPLTKLLNLPQMRSVRDYQTEFEDKASHVTKVPEAILDSELLSRKGLQPTTLTEAFDVVYRALERNYQGNRTEVQEKSQEQCDQEELAVHGHLNSRYPPNTLTTSGEDAARGDIVYHVQEIQEELKVHQDSHTFDELKCRGYLMWNLGKATGADNQSQGIKGLRGTIPADPNDIFVTDGAGLAVHTMKQQLLTRPEKDGILCHVPHYSPISASTALQGGSLVSYYLDEATGWGLEVFDVKQQLEYAKSVTMIKMQVKRSLSQVDIVINLCCKMDRLFHCWGDTFLEVSLPVFIFSLYALEEVYKDLILHLEDKVVLKG